jgi:hypothetical protein
LHRNTTPSHQPDLRGSLVSHCQPTERSACEALTSQRPRKEYLALGLQPQVGGFRDAHHAAKLRTANLANLFVMARELNMIEGPDGIMVRQAALPSKRAQSVRSSDGSSLRSSATSQKPTQSNTNRLPRAPAAPSRSGGAFDRRLHKTYFNDLKHSDLMITLSDRFLYVHCVVLCRVSECFDLLLENNHKVC